MSLIVLMPDPANADHADRCVALFERLREALQPLGRAVQASPWTDHVASAEGLRDADLVLPLLAWGYHADHARWRQACRTWQEAGVRIANPAPVLAWNSDKRYLARLADAGVPIPPTTWACPVTDAHLAEAFAATDATQLVVKPTVSGGAWRTQRLARGQALRDAPEGEAMLQPYLPSIETDGETSLVFFGGRFSHAVNKRPVPGDFRVQVQFGGHYTVLPTPPPAALALAERALAAVAEPLLYARVDVVPDGAGGWLLMELELIEPDLYLAVVGHADATLAAAVRAWMSAGGAAAPRA